MVGRILTLSAPRLVLVVCALTLALSTACGGSDDPVERESTRPPGPVHLSIRISQRWKPLVTAPPKMEVIPTAWQTPLR